MPGGGWTTFDVPCDSAMIPRLRPALPKRRAVSNRVHLKLWEIAEHDLKKLSVPMRDALRSGGGLLEDLFQEGTSAQLYIVLMCQDSFSGVNRVIVSPTFVEVSTAV